MVVQITPDRHLVRKYVMIIGNIRGRAVVYDLRLAPGSDVTGRELS